MVVVAGSVPTPTHGVRCRVSTWIWTCACEYGHAPSVRPTYLEDCLAEQRPYHPFFRRANSGDHLCTGYQPLAKRSSEGVRQVPRTLRLPMRCGCAARTAHHPRYTPQDLEPALRGHARPTNRCHSEKQRRTKCRHRSSMRRQSMPSNTRSLPLSCSRSCSAANYRTSTRF